MNIIKPLTRQKLTVHACGIETRVAEHLCNQGRYQLTDAGGASRLRNPEQTNLQHQSHQVTFPGNGALEGVTHLRHRRRKHPIGTITL